MRERKRFKLFSIQELLAVAPPTWLIENSIPEGAFALLYGPSGVGKSTVALDMALSLAAGTSEPTVLPRTVVYVTADPVSGLVERVKAWTAQHGLGVPPPTFSVLEASRLRDADDGLDAILLALDPPPALIVIDIGAVGDAVPQLGSLRSAAVLLVHPKRGSKRLREAADVTLLLQRQDDADTLRLINDKQRDHAAAPARSLVMKSISLGVDDRTGREMTSLVVIPRPEVPPTRSCLPSRIGRSDGAAANGL